MNTLEKKVLGVFGLLLLAIALFTIPKDFYWRSCLTGVLLGEAATFFTMATAKDEK